eukprot:COSAG01_NODE_1906_length_8932_cov_6.105263_2_plen_321_part_00
MDGRGGAAESLHAAEHFAPPPTPPATADLAWQLQLMAVAAAASRSSSLHKRAHEQPLGSSQQGPAKKRLLDKVGELMKMIKSAKDLQDETGCAVRCVASTGRRCPACSGRAAQGTRVLRRAADECRQLVGVVGRDAALSPEKRARVQGILERAYQDAVAGLPPAVVAEAAAATAATAHPEVVVLDSSDDEGQQASVVVASVCAPPPQPPQSSPVPPTPAETKVKAAVVAAGRKRCRHSVAAETSATAALPWDKMHRVLRALIVQSQLVLTKGKALQSASLVPTFWWKVRLERPGILRSLLKVRDRPQRPDASAWLLRARA